MVSKSVVLAVPRADAWAIKFAGAAAFALALGLSAAVRFPLLFTPVPVTLQTMVVVLAGAALGVRWGAAAVIGYLFAGTLGIPFFAAGTGLAAVAGPTGGYLIGFIAGAAVAGLGNNRHWIFRTAFMLAGIGAIYICGVAHLVLCWRVSMAAALQMGVLPFMAVDVAKVAIAAATYIPGAAFFKSFISMEK